MEKQDYLIAINNKSKEKINSIIKIFGTTNLMEDKLLEQLGYIEKNNQKLENHLNSIFNDFKTIVTNLNN